MREDEEDNHTIFICGDVWGFNGYAFGAFRGFERASYVTVEKAKEYLINEHGLTPKVAEKSYMSLPWIEKQRLHI